MTTQIRKNPPIAVIGMGCFFPKATGLKAYWRLLFQAIDAVTDIPENSHWSAADYYDPNPGKADRVCCKRGGFLSPVMFDPTEFGIPPAILEATDTSQLLGLAAARAALRDAGYDDARDFDRDRTSVILGVTGTQELVIPLSSRLGYPKWEKALRKAGIPASTISQIIDDISGAYVPWQENSFPGLLGNVVAGRICNRLNLGGTNCVVDAACASSMGALHLALMELSSGKSDMAVSGGVDALNDIFMHMCFSKSSVLSRSGDARPFSKHADGTVLGEGVGMIILKRLEDAEKDRDRIYAVIRGMGSSSDGKFQSIYAPRMEGQIKALKAAYEAAGVSPATIGLVEAHGTGTRVGDQVEFNALCKVYGPEMPEGRRCALGSVKSMIGHTKAAAGAAGLIKAVLSLHHKTLPPTLKADEPDPNLNIESSPLYLNTATRPWFSTPDHPRRAAVSAFGFGGSNFHAVLEEYCADKADISWDGSVEILAFDAQSPEALRRRLQEFESRLPQGFEDAFPGLAHETRQSFSAQAPCRLLMVIQDPADLPRRITKALDAIASHGLNPFSISDIFYGSGQTPGKIGFAFPGQGSQYLAMGRDLTCIFPQAMKRLEAADAKCSSLNDRIYPIPACSDESKKDQEKTLRRTDAAQPAIGAVSMAMFDILNYFGIRPDAVCGHSYGELCALHAAGRLDADAFLSLSVLRGRLMAEAGGKHAEGAMAAVKSPLKEIERIIRDFSLNVTLANRNSPEQGVLSGSIEAVTKAEDIFRQNGLETARLPVSAAFHSPLMQEAQKPFAAALERIDFSKAKIPVFSNVSGRQYPEDSQAARKLLADQILCPVDFLGNIENLFADGVRTFVEVGPKAVLTGLIRAVLKDRNAVVTAVDASAGRRSGIVDLARTLCHLASLGYPADLARWENAPVETRPQRMRIPVCGANFKPAPVSKEPAPLQPAGRSAQVEPVQGNDAPQAASEQAVLSPESERSANAGLSDMTQTPKNKPDIRPQQPVSLSFQALEAVQQGLKSLQELQRQTTRAHEKFLETQAQASRTLQEMMESTRKMTGIVLEAQIASAGESVQKPAIQIPDSAVSKPSEAPPRISSKPDPVQMRETADVSPLNPEKQTTAAADSECLKITETLTAVVSRLTGYPAEMLDPDMDMEADLGIDSIKRVEIFSALEEAIPGLPPVAPEHMARIRTLAQVSEHLKSSAPENRTQDAPPEKTVADPDIPDSKIAETLTAVVSRLTGYPAEMLDPDMDMEADLGIDSIKRVEIFSALEEAIPELPPVAPEHMARIRTLAQVSEHLMEITRIRPGVATHTASDDCGVVDENLSGQPVARSIVEIHCEAYDKSPSLPDIANALCPGKCVYVSRDRRGLAKALSDMLTSAGIDARPVSLDSLSKTSGSQASGLIIVADSECNDAFLKKAFSAARRLGSELTSSAQGGGAVFAAVTAMDGAFGFQGKGGFNPVQGGLAGLVKTAAVEWAPVLCRAVDIDPQFTDIASLAKRLVCELFAPGPVEIGLTQSARQTLVLRTAEYSPGSLDLNEQDLVVITGGARGVTAAAAKALARCTKSRLALLGRSENPFEEPAWLKDLTEAVAMKKAILDNEFSGQKPTPARLESAFRRYSANREIIFTLEEIRSSGSQVRYVCADVRNPEAVRSVLDRIRSDLGPVRALIHGAGVLEDRRIVDKTPAQFDHVYDTKVRGFQALMEALFEDPLKYIVLFSSVAARSGNRGQVDYAMANEVLNKTAQNLAVERPDCRVVSINWGPWDGGMVGPGLKREFSKNNIPLIPIQNGAQSLIQEMSGQGPAEVIIGAGLMPDVPAPVPQEPPVQTENLFLAVKREVELSEFPILEAHKLDGKSVVPFALIAEWLGHGALHANPGLVLCGMDDIRLLKGIKLNPSDRKLIRLMAGKSRKNGSFFEVDVEIRNGIPEEKDMVHYRARALLADRTPASPRFDALRLNNADSYTRPMKEVYDKVLFHGEPLQGIRRILSLSPTQMVASVSSAPPPSSWMTAPLRSAWIGDPLALDSAFQMASLWCYEQMGNVSLPSYVASYRQYCRRFPSGGLTVVLQIRETSEHKLKGDFVFLDADRRVAATLTGYEAVMDAALYRAFKPQYAQSA